jgi:hypothetical protein
MPHVDLSLAVCTFIACCMYTMKRDFWPVLLNGDGACCERRAPGICRSHSSCAAYYDSCVAAGCNSAAHPDLHVCKLHTLVDLIVEMHLHIHTYLHMCSNCIPTRPCCTCQSCTRSEDAVQVACGHVQAYIHMQAVHAQAARLHMHKLYIWMVHMLYTCKAHTR